MLKIAICDDNISDLSNIVSLIDDYQELQMDKGKIKYHTFHNGLDLIAAMESGQPYDLIFLDVLMPFMTGMDAAKEIRQFNQEAKIIFTTSSPEYAVESYAVDAYYYALKPIWKEKLFLLLDKVISERAAQTDLSLLVKSKTGLTRITFNRLEFAEITGRTICYHLTDGTVVEALGSMQELEKELLSNGGFIKTHRSYIINMEQVFSIGTKEVIMQSKAVVPLAKGNARVVKEAYMTFAFETLNTVEWL